jgi:SNF2 family DNA or RNA helicase
VPDFACVPSQNRQQHEVTKHDHATAKGKTPVVDGRTSDIATDPHLRKQISSHPFLFDWPRDQDTGDLIVDDNLVNASGKMLLLQRLLDALFDRGHKVLIFSQFTTMLDVIVRHPETRKLDQS